MSGLWDLPLVFSTKLLPARARGEAGRREEHDPIWRLHHPQSAAGDGGFKPHVSLIFNPSLTGISFGVHVRSILFLMDDWLTLNLQRSRGHGCLWLIVGIFKSHSDPQVLCGAKTLCNYGPSWCKLTLFVWGHRYSSHLLCAPTSQFITKRSTETLLSREPVQISF